jgi:hypothetical protein
MVQVMTDLTIVSTMLNKQLRLAYEKGSESPSACRNPQFLMNAYWTSSQLYVRFIDWYRYATVHNGLKLSPSSFNLPGYEQSF